MRRPAFYVLGLGLLLSTVLAAGPARASTCDEYFLGRGDLQPPQVAANMTGAQVVSSGQLGAGDPDGTGTVVLTFQDVVNKMVSVSYQVDTTNVAIPLEGAHIHRAAPGQIGVSAAPLFGFTDQADRSGVIPMSKCMAHDLFHRPADFYVDVHNFEYPDAGAVRGQLSKAL
jgi:hypothetical protein